MNKSPLLWWLLIIGILNLPACTKRPPLNGHDGRGCIQGVVYPWELAHVKRWAPNAAPYDILKNSTCEADADDEKVLDVQRRTHKAD